MFFPAAPPAANRGRRRTPFRSFSRDAAGRLASPWFLTCALRRLHQALPQRVPQPRLHLRQLVSSHQRHHQVWRSKAPLLRQHLVDQHRVGVAAHPEELERGKDTMLMSASPFGRACNLHRVFFFLLSFILSPFLSSCWSRQSRCRPLFRRPSDPSLYSSCRPSPGMISPASHPRWSSRSSAAGRWRKLELNGDVR